MQYGHQSKAIPSGRKPADEISAYRVLYRLYGDALPPARFFFFGERYGMADALESCSLPETPWRCGPFAVGAESNRGTGATALDPGCVWAAAAGLKWLPPPAGGW